jgi:ATP-dependent DNA helicase HFM1/MER3
VQIFIRLKAHASERDLLEAMSKSDEFGDVRFHSDKKLLNDINKDPGIKYPVVGRVTEIHQKVFLIIQSSIGGVSLEHADQQKATKSHSLSFDAKLIMRNATRILKGVNR